jgi:hypothetical protein
MKVAILDDYQNVALRLADWSGVRRHSEITCSTTTLPSPRRWSSACGRSTRYALCANARRSLGRSYSGYRTSS